MSSSLSTKTSLFVVLIMGFVDSCGSLLVDSALWDTFDVFLLSAEPNENGEVSGGQGPPPNEC